MASSLSNLVKNLSELIHKIICKYGHDDKKSETCRVKYKYCDCFLEYTIFLQYKCFRCNKNYQQKFDLKLQEQRFNTYRFSKHDKNKVVLLLRKGIYRYEYMND